jgi:hypothetical protein
MDVAAKRRVEWNNRPGQLALRVAVRHGTHGEPMAINPEKAAEREA